MMNLESRHFKKGGKMKGDDISCRLVELAVQVIKLIRILPKNYVGKHVGKQLIRSATSGGANYEEARGAESNADFIHKLKIVLKELRESIFWLKVIEKAELITTYKLEKMLKEFGELANIIAQSIITIQERMVSKKIGRSENKKSK